MRCIWAIVWSLWVLAALAGAQSIRSLGMGGTLLPGPELEFYNPAYKAYAANKSDLSLYLPFPGILGLLRPESNIFNLSVNPDVYKTQFTPVALYDQLSRPNEFLTNPVKGPREVRLTAGGGRLALTDEKGQPLNVDITVGSGGLPRYANGLTPRPVFRLSGATLQEGLAQTPEYFFDLEAFYGTTGLRITPNDSLRTALQQGSTTPNQTYSITASTSAEAGIGLNFTYATALSKALSADQVAVYSGLRASTFYRLGYLEATGQAELTTDASNNLANPLYSSRILYAYPGRGFSAGVRGDMGLLWDFRDGVLGIGARNLASFVYTAGRELELSASNPDRNILSPPRSGFESRPAFLVNAAYRFRGKGESAFLGGDIGFDGNWSGHVGLEYSTADFAYYRIGVGLEDGWRVGVGLSYIFANTDLDLAFTSKRTALGEQTVFGIAAGLGIKF
jgi:hypothetical protein